MDSHAERVEDPSARRTRNFLSSILIGQQHDGRCSAAGPSDTRPPQSSDDGILVEAKLMQKPLLEPCEEVGQLRGLRSTSTRGRLEALHPCSSDPFCTEVLGDTCNSYICGEPPPLLRLLGRPIPAFLELGRDMSDEEGVIRQLFGEAGLRPAGSEDVPLTLDAHRDVLVLDTACGGQGGWTTKVSANEVDFVECQESGWAACVSVILSLYSGAESHHRHDETGSGRVERQPCKEAALCLAEQRAVQSARRRLAKRYANALPPGVLETIERKIRSGHHPSRRH